MPSSAQRSVDAARAPPRTSRPSRASRAWIALRLPLGGGVDAELAAHAGMVGAWSSWSSGPAREHDVAAGVDVRADLPRHLARSRARPRRRPPRSRTSSARAGPCPRSRASPCARGRVTPCGSRRCSSCGRPRRPAGRSRRSRAGRAQRGQEDAARWPCPARRPRPAAGPPRSRGRSRRARMVMAVTWRTGKSVDGRVVAGVVAERALGAPSSPALDVALEHDLGVGGHLEVDRAALHDLDRLAAQEAGHHHLVDVLGQRARARVRGDRIGAERDRDLHAPAPARASRRRRPCGSASA